MRCGCSRWSATATVIRAFAGSRYLMSCEHRTHSIHCHACGSWAIWEPCPMSDLRIGLVAEGPLDRVTIEAALKAIIPRPFVLTLLQPEPRDPRPTNGWCGVLKWCQQFAARGQASLEVDPTLAGFFDLYVLHVHADCRAPG